MQSNIDTLMVTAISFHFHFTLTQEMNTATIPPKNNDIIVYDIISRLKAFSIMLLYFG